MTRVVFFLEERSAQAMLQGLLPRLFPGLSPVYVVFQGKQQLEKELPKRLRAWAVPGDQFVVLRDQDGEDCVQLKQRLVGLCRRAGKTNTAVRIACRELEAWYLGDLEAVEKALQISGLQKLSQKAAYRNPDRCDRPSEQLRSLTDGQYQKIDGSRRIGRQLDLANNRSPSFLTFLHTLQGRNQAEKREY